MQLPPGQDGFSTDGRYSETEGVIQKEDSNRRGTPSWEFFPFSDTRPACCCGLFRHGRIDLGQRAKIEGREGLVKHSLWLSVNMEQDQPGNGSNEDFPLA